MLTMILTKAYDDVEAPTLKLHAGDCGCQLWITPSQVATRLAMDTCTTCTGHFDPSVHTDAVEWPRERLAVHVGSEMAVRLIAMATRRMKEGLSI